eukprot:TRINITY_DN3555_c1_g1_i5.p14 TRINITY_DN3555_c1_g1~~TRINITY_DN3555_c1_g1_i5.p14  ORF type:complete len:153 (-),score=28.63 TRINITY_DN3555_c1_g1_i5:1636-2094(-)
MDQIPEDIQAQLSEMEDVLTELEKGVDATIEMKKNTELAPLQEAYTQLLLARSAQAIYDIYINTLGKEPDSKTNLTRLQAYTQKVQQTESTLSSLEDQQELKIDVAAATRFIEHALPELTNEQKQQMNKVRQKYNDKQLDKMAQDFMEEVLK